ncbi:hypothetical protein H632_c206p0, partial [Helicosporidium sp. ATCC 50920]
MGSTLQSTSSLSNSCAPGLDLAISPVLLVGSPGAGTVALLFQYAHAAARAGLNVVILGSRESLSDNHPVVDSKAASDPVWRDVHLKYLSNVQEALLYLGGVHLLDPEFRPHLILLHDALGLCSGVASDKGGRSREALLCRLFAQFADAATHLHKAGLASAPAPLADALSGSRAILSIECEMENPCVALAQRWLPDCFPAL